MAVMGLPSRGGETGVQLFASSFVLQTRFEPVKTVFEFDGSIAMKAIQTLPCSASEAGGETSLFTPPRKRKMCRL